MSESYTAVGMVEFNSIAAGIDAADQMVKTAQVDPLFFKTICPGKFVAAVTGDVAAVSASVNAGRETHADALVDWFIIPNIHRDVIGALAGATGLQLGWALIASGRLSRSESLRLAAHKSVQILCGVMVFLLIAAFIEAYWSSTTGIPPWVKYLTGTVLWLLVAAYLSLAGRTRHAPE